MTRQAKIIATLVVTMGLAVAAPALAWRLYRMGAFR